MARRLSLLVVLGALTFASAAARAEIDPQMYEQMLRHAREVYQVRVVNIAEASGSDEYRRVFQCEAQVLVAERTQIRRRQGDTFRFETYVVRRDAQRRGFVGPASPPMLAKGDVYRIYFELADRGNGEVPRTDQLSIAAYGRSFQRMSSQQPAAVIGQRAYVTAWRANLQDGPKVIGQVPFRKTATIRQVNGDFYRVNIEDINGREHDGWIYSRDVIVQSSLAGDDLETVERLTQAHVALDKLDNQFTTLAELGMADNVHSLTSWLYGPAHPRTTTALHNAAFAHARFKPAKGVAGNVEDEQQRAIALYENCVALETLCLGPRHPAIADTLENLAGVLTKRKEFERAEALFKQALDMFAEFPDTDTEASHTMNAVGVMYDKTERHELAQTYFLKALAIRQAAFGDDDERTVTVKTNLADSYEQSRKLTDALRLYLQCLASEFRTLGRSHASTARSLKYVNDLYKTMGRSEADMLSLDKLTPELINERMQQL